MFGILLKKAQRPESYRDNRLLINYNPMNIFKFVAAEFF